jgi:hypothetical protein
MISELSSISSKLVEVSSKSPKKQDSGKIIWVVDTYTIFSYNADIETVQSSRKVKIELRFLVLIPNK